MLAAFWGMRNRTLTHKARMGLVFMRDLEGLRGSEAKTQTLGGQIL